jgi:RNA polymerase sigma-70 factor (ECF subfamily)
MTEPSVDDERLLTDAQRERGLADRARAGDQGALKELVARHAPRAYVLAWGITRSVSDAEAMVQASFALAAQKLPSLPPGAPFAPWLYRWVANTALAAARKRDCAPDGRVELLLPVFKEDGRHRVPPTVPARGVEDLCNSRVLAAALEAVVLAVPLSERVVLLLREVAGLSEAETADVLGSTEDNIRARHHRARLAVHAQFILHASSLPS